ncbi:MAG: biotin carboxylase N-terminal domain-containing protein [Anaerolineales bacterium]
MISAAELTDAVAIHPGYGFLSENSSSSGHAEVYAPLQVGAR